MHLSRLSTMAICARIFMSCLLSGSMAGRRRCPTRLVEPVDFVQLAHDHEFVAVGAHGAVIIMAVVQLGITAYHVRRFEQGSRHRVRAAAAQARYFVPKNT